MTIHPSATVHPAAVVEPGAKIGAGCTIGAFALIGPEVTLGSDVTVKSHAVVTGWTEIGDASVIFPFATVGEVPQDLKYHGERTRLIVGARCRIREGATLNTGTEGGGGVTRVGDDCLIMTGAHVGHDAQIGTASFWSIKLPSRATAFWATMSSSAGCRVCINGCASGRGPSSGRSQW